MDFKNIKVRVEEAIGFVQIDRVADKNSLNIETSKEILQALTRFDQDNTIKCIAIEGNQKLFSPGADIKELDSLTKNTAAEKKLFDAFDEIYNIKKPVVALVEGYALGTLPITPKHSRQCRLLLKLRGKGLPFIPVSESTDF